MRGTLRYSILDYTLSLDPIMAEVKDGEGEWLESEQPKKRRKKGKSPTARTLEYLRKQGATYGVVERFNSFTNQRADLLGCIDVIVLRDKRIVGIQCTSGSNHSSHIQKALAEPRLITWLQCGGLYEVWSWSKTKPRGQREQWTCRVEAIELPSTQLSLI